MRLIGAKDRINSGKNFQFRNLTGKHLGLLACINLIIKTVIKIRAKTDMNTITAIQLHWDKPKINAGKRKNIIIK